MIKDLEGEIWKDCPHYAGYFQVSNLGRVKRLESSRVGRDGKRYLVDERLMTPQVKRDGYCYVSITLNGETHYPAVHRLVAKTFLDNPDDKPEVNHIDRDTKNNRADNLQWVTREENMQHWFKTARKFRGNFYLDPARKRSGYEIEQYDTSGKFIARFSSVSQASRDLGIGQTNIHRVLRGERRTAGGFVWKMVN